MLLKSTKCNNGNKIIFSDLKPRKFLFYVCLQCFGFFTDTTVTALSSYRINGMHFILAAQKSIVAV